MLACLCLVSILHHGRLCYDDSHCIVLILPLLCLPAGKIHPLSHHWHWQCDGPHIRAETPLPVVWLSSLAALPPSASGQQIWDRASPAPGGEHQSQPSAPTGCNWERCLLPYHAEILGSFNTIVKAGKENWILTRILTRISSSQFHKYFEVEYFEPTLLDSEDYSCD